MSDQPTFRLTERTTMDNLFKWGETRLAIAQADAQAARSRVTKTKEKVERYSHFLAVIRALANG